MFILISKLILLKGKLKKWHKVNYSFLQSRITTTEKKLALLTPALQSHDASPALFAQEKDLLLKLSHLKKAYYSDLQQRSKLDFISCNDESYKYFFKKRATSRILTITDRHSVHCETQDSVSATFIDFYQDLLGSPAHSDNDFDSLMLQGPTISRENSEGLVAEVSYDEIHSAVFSMASDKSPGPDGFTHSVQLLKNFSNLENFFLR